MDTIKSFIKKPVKIEAVQFIGEHQKDLIHKWTNGMCTVIGKAVKINTLNGYVYANEGEWILKGIENEFYPCQDDIFKKLHIEL